MNSEIFDVLMSFLSFRPEDSIPVLAKFAELDGAVSHFDGGKNNFVYLPGDRKDRVLLVAHSDTVWDKYYHREYSNKFKAFCLSKRKHLPKLYNNIISQGGSKVWGLSADDRAGCAMLWLLKDSGHSVLVTDGEEHSQISANYIADNYPELYDELNDHNYMIQLDRRGSHDYKTYDIPVKPEFLQYIEENTGYSDAGKNSRTDIVALCRDIAGVNLSIGYYDEHHEIETLNIDEWQHTYDVVKNLLCKTQPKFKTATAE